MQVSKNTAADFLRAIRDRYTIRDRDIDKAGYAIGRWLSDVDQLSALCHPGKAISFVLGRLLLFTHPDLLRPCALRTTITVTINHVTRMPAASIRSNQVTFDESGGSLRLVGSRTHHLSILEDGFAAVVAQKRN